MRRRRRNTKDEKDDGGGTVAVLLVLVVVVVPVRALQGAAVIERGGSPTDPAAVSSCDRAKHAIASLVQNQASSRPTEEAEAEGQQQEHILDSIDLGALEVATTFYCHHHREMLPHKQGRSGRAHDSSSSSSSNRAHIQPPRYSVPTQDVAAAHASAFAKHRQQQQQAWKGGRLRRSTKDQHLKEALHQVQRRGSAPDEEDGSHEIILCLLSELLRANCSDPQLNSHDTQRPVSLRLRFDAAVGPLTVPATEVPADAAQHVASLLLQARPVTATFYGRVFEADLKWVLASSPATAWGSVTNITLQGLVSSDLTLSILNPLPNITTINLRGNHITNVIQGAPFPRRAAITHLSIAENALRAFPSAALEGMTLLEELHLNSNRILTLQPTEPPFPDTTRLRRVVLDHNRIRTLPDRIFAAFPRIKHLSLAENDIASMGTAAFSRLSDTTHLSLRDNPLGHLPVGVLDPLQRLQHLDLGDTAITELDAAVFQRTRQISTLLLNNMRLRSLPAGIFANVHNLTHLSLGDNALPALPPTLFQGLTALAHVDLRTNRITSLPATLFAPLSALRRLFMQRNRLQPLPLQLFASQSQLQVLELSHNEIPAVSQELFVACTRLEALSMRANKLTAFDIALPALRSLRLGNNPLSTLPNTARLPLLEALRINNHRIATVDFAAAIAFRSHRLHVVEVAVDPMLAGTARLVGGAHLTASNTTSLDTLDVRGLAVDSGVLRSLFAGQLQVTRLHMGWSGMTEETAPLHSTVCRALDATVAELTLENTGYTTIDLCPGHDLHSVALPANEALTKLVVHTAVQQLNVSQCPLLAVLVLPRAEVLDVSGTLLPVTPALCGEWGSRMLFARNLLNPRMRETAEQQELMRQCLRAVEVLDVSDNPWLNDPFAMAEVASHVTVLGNQPLVAEDFTALPHRPTVPLLTMQHTPVTCGLDLHTIRARLGDNPHELLASQLAYLFLCGCSSGFTMRNDRCQREELPLAAVVTGSIGGLLLLQVLVLVAYRWCRSHRRLRADHELRVQLLEEREAEVLALKAGWAIDYNELTLDELVASGAYGDVWRARWDTLTVAVKVLKQSVMAFDDATVDEFEREVSFLQRTRHPHLVRFFGAGTDQGNAPFLVLEYVGVGSLRSLLQSDLASVLRRAGASGACDDMKQHEEEEEQKGKGEREEKGLAGRNSVDGGDLVVRDTLGSEQSECRPVCGLKYRLCGDIASGMAFIHSLGQLHRDLKSANVLVSDRLRAKITDFGTIRQHFTPAAGAAATNRATTTTSSGPTAATAAAGGVDATATLTAGVGTPLYMAPEALAGGRYNAKADVFSFGVIMWEVATQHTPDLILQERGPGFRGPTLATLSQLLEDGRRLRFDEGLDVASWFMYKAQQCMAHDPHARPSFDDLRDRFRH